MWRVWLTVGWCVWCLTLLASAAMNYLAGSGFGRTAHESYVFGGLGGAADLWKALGPIFIVSITRNRRYITALLAACVWLACFAFAVTAAMGLAAQNRSSVVGGREALKLSYQSASTEIEKLERQRATITESRTPAEIEAGLAAIFARPIGERGTVGTLSRECTLELSRTRVACSEAATLRQALASALEAQRLDDRLQELRREIIELRERGGSLDVDPQAQLISRLSFGRLAASEVGTGLILLLVAMVELISAFAPLILHEFSAAMRVAPVADGRDLSRPDQIRRDVPDVYEYLVERTIPDTTGSVSAVSLVSDFRDWCDENNYHVPSLQWFISTFDEICVRDLDGRVQRIGEGYVGFRLQSQTRLLSAA